MPTSASSSGSGWKISLPMCLLSNSRSSHDKGRISSAKTQQSRFLDSLTYTIKYGEQRTMYHCSSCGCSFSETKNTPIAHLKTPISVIVQVISALTEGVGINAVTRLYSVSKNSVYRWQERLSGLKKER